MGSALCVVVLFGLAKLPPMGCDSIICASIARSTSDTSLVGAGETGCCGDGWDWATGVEDATGGMTEEIPNPGVAMETRSKDVRAQIHAKSPQKHKTKIKPDTT